MRSLCGGSEKPDIKQAITAGGSRISIIRWSWPVDLQIIRYNIVPAWLQREKTNTHIGV